MYQKKPPDSLPLKTHFIFLIIAQTDCRGASTGS